MRNTISFIMIACCLILLIPIQSTLSGTTGKIAGRVTDQNSDEGLAGVNIFITDSPMGTATDLEGYYSLLNIPPGQYSLTISAIGYKKVIMEDVICRVNYTTSIHVAMEEEIVEGETVTIIAERPLIEIDQTGSKDVVTSQEIEILPVTNFDQVVELQAGIVGKNFRGGRDTEVLYLVDGIQVLEPISGQRSATVGIQAVENLEVISGTFNAEYGNAMSGIVNAITKEGGDKNFTGNVELYSGNYLSDSKKWYPNNTSLDLSGIYDIRATFNGPVPFLGKKVSFLLSGGYQNNDGFLTGNRYFQPTDISIEGAQNENASFIATGDSAFVPLNDSEEINLLGKLNFSISNALKFSYSLLYNKRAAHERWAYDDNNWDQWRWAPLGTRKQHNESFNHIFSLTQVTAPNAFYTIRVGYQDHAFGNYVYEDPLDKDYLPGIYRQNNLTGDNLIIGGTELNDDRRNSTTLTVKGDLTWQATHQHEIKTGFEGLKYKVEEDTRIILFANETTFQSELSQGLVADWCEHPIHNDLVNMDYQYYHTDLAGDVSFYSRTPIKGSFYIQDKMEFSSVVVNAGLRFDYFDSRYKVPKDSTDPSGSVAYPDLSREEALEKALEDAPAQTQISPRFGLAYQVTKNGVINFSYGHFFQIPPLEFLYANPKFLVLPGIVSSEVMGNAGLKPQRTISYELTYRELITDFIASEISFYYRDIHNLLGTEALKTLNGQPYTRYANRAYGNVKGIILGLDVRMGSFFADIDYTFQVARGNASDPDATLIALQNGRGENLENIRLDWDQRHTINASVNYSVPKYSISLVAKYGSGNPFDYQPLASAGRPILQFVENNSQQPNNFNLDLNASYKLGRYAGIDVSFYLQCYNLLDRRNPHSVFGDSGSPDSSPSLELNRESLEKATFTTPESIFYSTNRFEAPRQIRFGVALNFK